jgi:hypothetical protein
MAYIPPFSTTPNDTFSWPTLSSMIASGKRVVIFLDSGANTALVPFILDEFTYMWETPFDQTNASFPCTVDRPPRIRNQVPTGRLAVVNHFLDTALPENILVPDRGQLAVTNGVEGVGSLGLQALDCAAVYGRYPNFFLVDCISPFYGSVDLVYDVGNVFQVAATVNGVPYTSPNSTSARSGAVLNRSQYGYVQFVFSMVVGVVLFWGLLKETLSCGW